jgi:hypothetical protein
MRCQSSIRSFLTGFDVERISENGRHWWMKPPLSKAKMLRIPPLSSAHFLILNVAVKITNESPFTNDPSKIYRWFSPSWQVAYALGSVLHFS